MLFAEFLKEYDIALSEAAAQVGSNGQVEQGLDALKLALDIWGFEPMTGWVGDAASGTISLGQALYKASRGQPGVGNHLLDAATSLVSIVPFGDIVKLLKLRYGPKYAQMAIKFARPIKGAAQNNKVASVNQRVSNFIPSAAGFTNYARSTAQSGS
jgi:hypothetical protein